MDHWNCADTSGSPNLYGIIQNGHNRKVHLDHLRKRVMVPEETLELDEVSEAVAYKDIPCRKEDVQHHQSQDPSTADDYGIPPKNMSTNINSDPTEESTTTMVEPVEQTRDQPSHFPTRPPDIPVSASPLPLRRSSRTSRPPKRYIEECS